MASSYEILLNIGGKLSSSLTKSTNSAEKALGGIQKSASLVKKVVGAAIGVAAASSVVSFGKSCVTAAEKAESAQTQLNTVLASTKGVSGMTADSANQLALSLSGVTTYSKSAIVSTENLLLTFTNIGSGVMPDVTEAALNMSTALGQDTSSSAMQLGKALNDPVKGISKLTKVGVTFTAAQKAQITAMEKAGNVAGAQKVILSELNTEFGNSAKAAATTTAGQKVLITNAINSIKGTIGTKLLPVVSSVLTTISAHVPDIISAIKKVSEHITPAVNYITGTVFPAVKDAITNKLIPAFQAAKDWVVSHMPQIRAIVGTVFSVVCANIKTTISVIKSIVSFISSHKVAFEALAAAVLAIVVAMKIWVTITKTISAVTKAFTAVQAALNLVMNMNPIGIVVLAIIGWLPHSLSYGINAKRSETSGKVYGKRLRVRPAALEIGLALYGTEFLSRSKALLTFLLME
jgi:hypothetical protein